MLIHNINELQFFTKTTLTEVFARPRNSALVFALVGELGSGKTTFVQCVAKELGIMRTLTSPTFTIFRKYKVDAKAVYANNTNKRKQIVLFHFDLYRLHDASELMRLGFEEIIASPNHIVLVEWADRAQTLMPHDAVWITFKHGNVPNERIVAIN